MIWEVILMPKPVNLMPALRDWLFCLSAATLILAVTSACSPFYAFNDWVDANSFMTMGKGMVHGLVPYRDLFEQKGPLLYLIHGLAYLIDHTGFFGVFVFEAANWSVVLYFTLKIARLFVRSEYAAFIALAFTGLTLSSTHFETGDSAEEFCFAFILVALYLMIRHFKVTYPNPLSDSHALLAGVTAGCVFMIKYTMLGYWAGFAFVLIVACSSNRRWIELLRNALFFFIGFLLACAPWLLYLALNRGLQDFWQTYLYINLRLYAKNLTLIERIRFIGQTLSANLDKNLVAGLVTLFGLYSFSFSRRFFNNHFGRLIPLACLFLMAGFSYFGARSSPYYFLAFFPFLIFGLIAVCQTIEKRFRLKLAAGQWQAALIGFCAVMVFWAISFSPNIPLLKNDREDYPQYCFAAIINQVPDATLLNYGFLDGGFYTAANITPTMKYFMINNISDSKLPVMRDEQERYLKEKLTSFVVIRMGKNADANAYEAPGLHENYELVSEMNFKYKASSTLEFKYALYKVRS